MPALDQLTVVIPLAPGEQAWRALLPTLCAQLPAGAEVVLVSAESEAQAPLPTYDFGPRLRVLNTKVGRGRQLNAGVEASQQPWVWLLHADSQLAANTLSALAAAPEAEYLGYFSLKFHDGSGLSRLTEFGTWLRSRLLHLPFGDQGFLIRRDLFQRLGGFDARLSSGEDHALVWAARRAGIRLRLLPATLYTSARKYRQQGWWRTTRHHLYLTWQQARRFSRAAS